MAWACDKKKPSYLVLLENLLEVLYPVGTFQYFPRPLRLSHFWAFQGCVFLPVAKDGVIRTGEGQDILALEQSRHEGREVGTNEPALIVDREELICFPLLRSPRQINQTVYIESVGRVDSDGIRPGLQGNSLKQELGTDENLNVFSQRSFQTFPGKNQREWDLWNVMGLTFQVE